MIRLTLDELRPLVAFCDPAGRHKGVAELKRVRARTALVVVGMDAYARKIVLEAQAGRWAATETIERMFELASRYRLNRFGVEANAMQECYAQMLADAAKRSGRYLPIEEFYQPTNVDKLWRIRSRLQPVLARGELVVDPHRHHELHVELASFPTGRTIDLVDALASALTLLPTRTAAISTAEERQKLADYLRRTGVAPGVIADRLAAFDAQARAA